MGLNPAWRNSLVYTTLGTSWQDGANLTEINAARQLLIQDMKILEGIAPESGAYFNEVRTPTPVHNTPTDSLHFIYTLCRVRCYRLRDTSSTGRNPSSALTTISFEPSSRNTIRIPCFSFTKVSDQTGGMQISSARSENHFETTPPTGDSLVRGSVTFELPFMIRDITSGPS